MSTSPKAAGWRRFRFPAAAVLPLGVFAVAFVVWAAWLFALPVLYDTDSYYHLAAARAYAAPGSLDVLPWARFSLMAEGFGDKEALFHTFLRPFATMADAGTGGRLALALLNALIAALMAAFARPALGRWAALVPFALPLLAPDLLWRLVRLRPELLSLALLLLVLAAAGKGRYRWLAPLAAAYTLAYTAFHALLGLCGLLFLWRGGVRGRWEPALVLYPVAGAGVGLALHPQFPHNLSIWWVQNVEFFRLKAGLDVGPEIGAARTDDVFLHLLGWAVALVALALSARAGERREAPDPDLQASADAFSLAAVVFGVLYLLMQRFVVYAVPLATLAVLLQLAARGWRPGRWCRMPGGRRIPLALGFVLAGLVAAPTLVSLVQALRPPRGEAPVRAREMAWAEFGRAIPPGALVAAPWGSAQVYMLYAPRALYLNVLDPVFMALPFPHEHAVARALFAGEEPDPAYATKAVLASDYLAFPSDVTHPRLQRRLMFDPRVAVVFTGYDLLYRVKSGANGAFLLDWQVQPGDNAGATWRPYPRAATAEARAVEGYVDATRLGATTGCLRFRQALEVAEAVQVEWEFAPAGPSALALDGQRLTAVQGDLDAVLGGGVRTTALLTPGRHQLEVLTCPSNEVAGRHGFYLVERGRSR